MIYLAWVIGLIASGLLGYYFRTIDAKIRALTTWLIHMERQQVPTVEDTKPAIFDGNDPALVAKYEFEERFERMNPHIKGNDGDK